MVQAWKDVEETVAGAACTHCWGPAKPFGDVDTPLHVTMTGVGFTGLCSPLNSTFVLDQDSFDPCLWVFDNGVVKVSWALSAIASTFFMMVYGVGTCYSIGESPCTLVSVWSPRTVTVSITDPNSPAYKIAIEQNFIPSDDGLYKIWQNVDSKEVLRFFNAKDNALISVKHTPD